MSHKVGGSFTDQAAGVNDKSAVIAAFVENGGAYIGLCAGAYYASSFVEFGIGTKYDLPSHACLESSLMLSNA